jgi:hypothetical protein
VDGYPVCGCLIPNLASGRPPKKFLSGCANYRRIVLCRIFLIDGKPMMTAIRPRECIPAGCLNDISAYGYVSADLMKYKYSPSDQYCQLNLCKSIVLNNF